MTCCKEIPLSTTSKVLSMMTQVDEVLAVFILPWGSEEILKIPFFGSGGVVVSEGSHKSDVYGYRALKVYYYAHMLIQTTPSNTLDGS